MVCLNSSVVFAFSPKYDFFCVDESFPKTSRMCCEPDDFSYLHSMRAISARTRMPRGMMALAKIPRSWADWLVSSRSRESGSCWSVCFQTS